QPYSAGNVRAERLLEEGGHDSVHTVPNRSWLFSFRYLELTTETEALRRPLPARIRSQQSPHAASSGIFGASGERTCAMLQRRYPSPPPASHNEQVRNLCSGTQIACRTR